MEVHIHYAKANVKKGGGVVFFPTDQHISPGPGEFKLDINFYAEYDKKSVFEGSDLVDDRPLSKHCLVFQYILCSCFCSSTR